MPIVSSPRSSVRVDRFVAFASGAAGSIMALFPRSSRLEPSWLDSRVSDFGSEQMLVAGVEPNRFASYGSGRGPSCRIDCLGTSLPS